MSKNSYIHKVLPGSPGGPLLFTFHGTGGDESQFLGLGARAAARRRRSSRRAATSRNTARRASSGAPARASTTWTTLRAPPARWLPSSVRMSRRQILRRCSGSAIRTAPTSSRRLLFADPALFDAAVLMHPLIPFEPEVGGNLAGRRVLITAGRRDPICPPNLTARLEAHLRARGADATVEWHEGGHEIRENEIEAARLFLDAAQRTGAK